MGNRVKSFSHIEEDSTHCGSHINEQEDMMRKGRREGEREGEEDK